MFMANTPPHRLRDEWQVDENANPDLRECLKHFFVDHVALEISTLVRE